MKIKRKITFYITLAIFAVCLIAALCTVKISAFAYTDRIEITSSAGDTFRAEETSFTKEQSFAFSATVNFNSGDAAALTFGETEKGLWAFNVDRAGNKVKLLYFTKTETGYAADELETDYFIGNDKMSAAEKLMVAPKVKQVDKVCLKVVITADEDKVYLECYADGIRRFAFTDGSSPAENIDILTAYEDLSYEGGNIGYNVCNADVYFSDVEVGRHDYSYYTELYRNQFHFSPYAHWNNDPNGMVYYNGYYHLFYQTYPFDKVWGDMYWGHARSTDLLYWEHLPICLYPERENSDGCWGDGNGYMWSGSARVYHKGESSVIDEGNWYKDISSLNEGDGAGLIAFYTRDGAKQDQMVMSSDDGGLTWTKRAYIPTREILALNETQTDCRDPKVFEFDNNGNRIFGMLLTGMNSDNVWFLKSEDFVNWTAAGGFKARGPLVNTQATNGVECPDIAFIEADNGVKKAVIALAGRGYIVGDMTYESGKFVFKVNGEDVSQLSLESVPVMQMDFGPDSYATQTFYIDDGEYAGRTISVSWFSGVPGASASVDSGLLTQLRSRWNCGMTIPAVWGLHYENEDYILTQTPITAYSTAGKTLMASVTDYAVTAGVNPLKNLTAAAMEINAVINNPEGGAVAFRVRVGSGEYTEIGWNETDGYYVDRSHTASGNLALPAYAAKYCCKRGGEQLSFRILCDNGSVEVFCDNGAAPFYVVTFPSPRSVGMSFISEKDVTFGKLEIYGISTTWRDYPVSEQLSVGLDNITLDLTLCKQKDILVHHVGNVSYEVTEGKETITYMQTADGIRITAESAGEAIVKVTCGSYTQYISVTVYGGEADSDCEYTEVTAGDWYVSADGYIGYTKAGDAFIFSDREGGDFMYSAQFDLRSGIAAALVFRASSDMSQYVIANYDNGAGLVKLWSSAGDSREVPKRLGDLSNIVLMVSVHGKNVKVYLNNEQVIDYVLCDEAPESGVFGLNVCAANVLFKAVSVTDAADGTYSSGNISWNHTDTAVFTIVNRSWNNRLVDSGFYTVEGRKVTLLQNYMASLPEAEKTYILEVRGQKSLYVIELKVEAIPSAVWQDVTIQENSNAVFFIGNAKADNVYVNGRAIDGKLYKIEGTQLTVYAEAFKAGENEVSYAEGLSAKVTVEGVSYLEPHFNAGNSKAIYTALFVIVGVVIAAEAAFIAYLIFFKKREIDGGDDQGRS